MSFLGSQCGPFFPSPLVRSLFFNLAAGHRGKMVEATMLGQAPRGVHGRLQPQGLRREDKREPGCDPEPLVNLAALHGLQDLSFPTRD